MSSSGSDSDVDMKEVDNYYADTSANDGQPQVPVESYDENAQDYSYSEAAAEGKLKALFALQRVSGHISVNLLTSNKNETFSVYSCNAGIWRPRRG